MGDACTGTRLRTWNLRVQSATCYLFHHPCARMHHVGWRSSAATPERFPPCRRARARDGCMGARTDTEHLRFQLGYSGCQRAGAIAHRPIDRWRFPLRGKEKGPGVCQALECRRFGDGLPRVLSSHLQGLAERTPLGILDAGMPRHGVPACACPRLRGRACCERADGHGQHGGRESTTSRRAVQATSRFPSRDCQPLRAPPGPPALGHDR